MKAGTASRLLVGIFSAMIAILALMALTGDDEARSILRPMVVAAVLVGGIFYLTHRYKVAPRRAMFIDQARRLGLTAVEGDPLDLLGSRFEVVRRRASVRDVETTATGTWEGHDVAVVDYWYAPTSRLEVDDYVRFVCALLPVPRTWPGLLVVPERIATLVGDAIGGHEPDTESEAFNRSFAVRTDDRRFTSAVLDGRMITWLQELPSHTGFEVRDGRLLCFVARQLDGDVEHALRTGRAFLHRVPGTARTWYG